jgi:hypothetical protein
MFTLDPPFAVHAKMVTLERTRARYEHDSARDREFSVANNALVSEVPREYAARSGRLCRTRDQGEVCVSIRSVRAAWLAAQKRKKSAENISGECAVGSAFGPFL